ncbi:MAG: leucine-rich repeat domain-containing protein [Ignavibacteria bacterium]|nr:leucine-rich repeat domain-containing protein [Ignavibacteria bacterium]
MKLLCSVVRTSLACARLWCLVPLVWMVVVVAALPARAQTTTYTVPEAAEANKLYTSTNGANWRDKQGWPLQMSYTTTASIEPAAAGVIFFGSRIQLLIKELDLSRNNLNGTISNFNLPNLQRLDLSYNELSGAIPSFDLPNLKVLSLGDNLLGGTIPNFNLPNLQYLSLSSNFLSGVIPNFNLPNLQYLSLTNNSLRGTIPNFNLPNLQRLSMGYNNLGGALPNFSLPNLQYLSLSSNSLSGIIPNFNLPNLEWLDLYNDQLSGCDVDWAKVPKLAYLFLARNKLVFRDLEPAAKAMQGRAGAVFSYNPQDSVATLKSGDTVRVDVGGEQTRYQWFRNGEAIINATQASYTTTDTALYSCRSTNTLLPSLTLYSRPVRGGAVITSVTEIKHSQDNQQTKEIITALNIRPNPFWEYSSISYSLTSRLPVSIAVYSLLGQKLLTVFDGEQNAGTHVQDLAMSAFSIGVYIVRVQAGDGVQSAFVHYVR